MKFSEHKIADMPLKADADAETADLRRRPWVPEATTYNRKAKYVCLKKNVRHVTLIMLYPDCYIGFLSTRQQRSRILDLMALRWR